MICGTNANYLLTDAGRARRAELDAAGNRSEEEIAELALLSLLEIEGRPVRADRLRKLPGGEAAAERLLRRRQLESREVAVHRHARVQKIVAWNSRGRTPASARRKKKRAFFMFSPRNAGLCRCRRSRNSAKVSRSLIERLIRQEKLKSWEEPLAVEEDLFEVDYTPPSNVLNVDQERELGEICGWLDAGAFKVGLLYGVTGSGKTEVYLGAVEAALRAEQDGAHPGSGNCADALDGTAVPRAARLGRCRASQRAGGGGARARVVARAARRSSRRGGDAIGGVRAARKSGPGRRR